MNTTAPAILPRAAGRRLLLALGLTVLATLAAACGAGAGSDATFDPAAPCTADVQQPGAYPELEALLPGSSDGTEPATVASGRTCTRDTLGSLAAHGITELRFAGATWEDGGSRGHSVAVFEAAGLEPGQMAEFYETGSKAVRPQDSYAVSQVAFGDQPAVRLDITAADGSTQAVIAWAEPGGGRVRALLVVNLDSVEIGRLLEELGGQ